MKFITQNIWPALAGAAVGMLLMPFAFGFVSDSSATERADLAAQKAYITVLTPQCVTNAKADPETLAELLKKSSYQQRSELSKTSWPIYPDGASSKLQSAISQACLDLLKAES